MTPVEGLFVAGNITGIEGAKVAAAQGKIAGLSIAKRSGKHQLDEDLKDAVQQGADTRKNAYIQFHPEVDSGRRRIQ
ncbi:FAD-dependent oxidoreductase, partial [Motilimonas sp. 1_MG-2023]